VLCVVALDDAWQASDDVSSLQSTVVVLTLGVRRLGGRGDLAIAKLAAAAIAKRSSPGPRGRQEALFDFVPAER